jgi:hypothetical protein
MTNIKTRAISFNLYYGGLSVSEMMAKKGEISTDEVIPVSEETPQFKDIYISDITCKGAEQAIYLQGLPEMTLKNVNLSQMIFETESGLLAMDADGINVDNVTLLTSKSPAITLFNAENVAMNDLVLSGSGQNLIEINGKKSRQIDISIQSEKSIKGRYSIGSEVAKSSVQINRN